VNNCTGQTKPGRYDHRRFKSYSVNVNILSWSYKAAIILPYKSFKYKEFCQRKYFVKVVITWVLFYDFIDKPLNIRIYIYAHQCRKVRELLISLRYSVNIIRKYF